MASPAVLELDAGGGLRLHVEQFSALGSRLSADGSRLPADGSRLSADGSRLSAPGSQLPADGSRLSADGSRRPPTLVLLHGFTSSSETWHALRSALQTQYTIVTVDLPGHGRSSAPSDPARYALDRLADDLALVLDELDTERAMVLGYSFGGRAALKFALWHPRRVSALVLESTSPGIEDPVERAARVTGDAELAEVLEREGIAAFVDRWERLPLWASQAALPEDSRARIRARRLAQSPIGLANALRGAGAGADPAVLQRLGEITVPVLLIAGALDLRYADLALQMAGHLPSSSVEILPDTGHAVHIERPEEYARVVRGFLANLES